MDNEISAHPQKCCGTRPDLTGKQHSLTDTHSAPWITGRQNTPAGPVARINTHLHFSDKLDHWKARWDIGRMELIIPPGLYAAGNPGPDDIITVSANYKPSFDALRSALDGLNAWILVLDTHGINVWCAAGKGTFGTDELLTRIEATSLGNVVNHRTLILPQLGAPGIAAHLVKKRSGFRIIYGPVRAADLKAFLASGMHADDAMRTVNFGLNQRLAVAPMELLRSIRFYLIYLAALAALAFLAHGRVSLSTLRKSASGALGAVLTGTVAFPALLPWLPGRAFSLQGWCLGFIWGIVCSRIQGAKPLSILGNVLALPAISAFLGLNYTGSTTFTSQTGVNKEIGLYARPMAITGLTGIILHIAAFLKGEYR